MIARRLYTVKDVADYVGVHVNTIMLAEKEGRLPAARRDELGHRFYDEHDRERISVMIGRR